MKTRYGRLWSAAWDEFEEAVQGIARDPGVNRVCEVGAGATPLLDLEFVKREGLDYVLLDASAEELDKADPSYAKIEANVEDPALETGAPFDLVFSQFTAEHVRSPHALHRNVHAMLAPGGLAAHFFPTLYAPPFVLNRLLPERLMHVLLMRVQPRRTDAGLEAKFPAYYRWCRGPSERQLRRFEGVGFEVVEYVGYFGHDYYEPVPGLRAISRSIAAGLTKRPIPWLTSYAHVVLRRIR